MDEEYMKLALQLAKATLGQTSPNPLVGAVVVQDGQIVGLGAHLKAGQAHAEVHALHMAGDRAEGATLYVTLEPCSHYGRTPPCADQVIAAKLKKVVIATLDPNPLVAGNGVQKLKKAGIEVSVGLFQQEAEGLNEAYNYFITRQKPYVALKTASTLDGKIATHTGESRWITGEEARADVHLLRHQYDAILVGINTVIKDNPQLTTRLPDGQGRHPIRLILDSKLRIPLDAQLLDITVAPTWIATTQQADQGKVKALQEMGITMIQTKDRAQVSIDQLLHELGQKKVASLLVEGGGEVNASFIEGKHVQKVITYLSPMLIGGHLAPGSFRGEGFSRLAEALHLRKVSYTPLGNDLKVVGYVQ